ncbi:uncharacterized protein EV420DRAFT_1480601 [Desarmillaria tabescens]|uniref:Uncharacterized protein n=1 Tax=Armillaria tabescens TaxID=1929756 RepID=A0AA39N4W6_ARMTA|nr:uncharacterized protein EV420DRAFT_1480601 [Desarmillaria tabescens]KAK0457534.1 hypothetical protein EV420DRAFT_1480601 [Desarmillaria tabescens]
MLIGNSLFRWFHIVKHAAVDKRALDMLENGVSDKTLSDSASDRITREDGNGHQSSQLEARHYHKNIKTFTIPCTYTRVMRLMSFDALKRWMYAIVLLDMTARVGATIFELRKPLSFHRQENGILGKKHGIIDPPVHYLDRRLLSATPFRNIFGEDQVTTSQLEFSMSLSWRRQAMLDMTTYLAPLWKPAMAGTNGVSRIMIPNDYRCLSMKMITVILEVADGVFSGARNTGRRIQVPRFPAP